MNVHDVAIGILKKQRRDHEKTISNINKQILVLREQEREL